MSESTEKKQVKCGNCGEHGHNKRTCPKNKPTSEPSKEVSDVVPKKVIMIKVTTGGIIDNEDEITNTRFILCSSLDSAHREIVKLVEQLNFDYANPEAEEEDTSSRDCMKRIFRNAIIYRDRGYFREIPIPTKEQVEATVVGKDSLNALILIGGLAKNNDEFIIKVLLSEEPLL